jgi:DNA-binding response OmpR family regulator
VNADAVGRGIDVLLVEDDPLLAAMYRIKLLAEGYEVRLAADGPSGLAAALAHMPDLLLLDIRLPGFDGFELLSRLRMMPGGAAVPVLVLSNYGEHGVIERGRELGVLNHLIKSQITPASLVATITGHLAEPEGETPSAR